MTIKIYGKPNCPKCDMAKAFMSGRAEYDYIDLTSDAESMAMVKGKSVREAPFIMDGDKDIGGFKELQEYLKQG